MQGLPLREGKEGVVGEYHLLNHLRTTTDGIPSSTNLIITYHFIPRTTNRASLSSLAGVRGELFGQQLFLVYIFSLRGRQGFKRNVIKSIPQKQASSIVTALWLLCQLLHCC